MFYFSTYRQNSLIYLYQLCIIFGCYLSRWRTAVDLIRRIFLPICIFFVNPKLSSKLLGAARSDCVVGVVIIVISYDPQSSVSDVQCAAERCYPAAVMLFLINNSNDNNNNNNNKGRGRGGLFVADTCSNHTQCTSITNKLTYRTTVK